MTSPSVAGSSVPPVNAEEQTSPIGEQRCDVQKKISNKSELGQKAHATRAGFQRPAVWVLIFGWSLAMCAGLVNVVAMQTFGTFVSHVTGDTTAIGLRIEGFHSGRHTFSRLGDSIALLLSFLLGAFACGLLIDKNQVHFGGKALYGSALIGNAVLLGLSIMVQSDLGGACLAATACGLQNAMCTSHFGAVVRTTHVTGTVTDIGSTMGRMAMIFLRRGCRRSRMNVLERAEVGVDARKLLVLLPMWLSFLSGCIAGAYLVRALGRYAMFVPAGITLSFGIFYAFFRHHFKAYITLMLKDRLNSDIVDVEATLERTHDYLRDLRRKKPRGSEADVEGGVELDDLESEVGHILESIHHLEEDLEDLQSATSDSPHGSRRRPGTDTTETEV